MSRPVKVFKMVPRHPSGYSLSLEKVDDGVGVFLAWGSDFHEFESGPGTYSTAIIERPDGTVQNVPVELIQFTDSARQ